MSNKHDARVQAARLDSKNLAKKSTQENHVLIELRRPAKRPHWWSLRKCDVWKWETFPFSFYVVEGSFVTVVGQQGRRSFASVQVREVYTVLDSALTTSPIREEVAS